MNSITSELAEISKKINKENEVVNKFIALNKKVKINNTDVLYSFEELVNKIPINILRTRVIELNKIINNLEPGINSDIVFYHTTPDGVLIEFTWKEMKEFIIEAIKTKEQNPKYKKLLSKYNKAKKECDIKSIISLGKQL